MTGLPLTSADTLLYVATTLKIPTNFEVPALPGTPAAGMMAAVAQWAEALKSQGISPDLFRAAFGGDASTQIDWPANSSQPDLVASLDVRDHAAAQKLLDGLVAAPLDGPTWQKTVGDKGAAFYVLSLPNVMFVSPTLTLTDKHLIAGLSAEDVRAAAARDLAGGGALANSEAFKTVSASVAKPNVSFVYLDAKAFFERAYGVLKPAAVMRTAIFLQQVGDYVDLGKLPATETITRHLSPTVFSEATDAQGVTMESLGSFTLGQAAVGLAMGVGAVAEPFIDNQYGLPMSVPAPAQKTPQSPSAGRPTK